MRLLHLYGQEYAPAFMEDDLLLLHTQVTAEDGDVVLAFHKNRLPGIYKVKKDDTKFIFLPFSKQEQSFRVEKSKLSTAGICAKIITLIRDF